MCIIVYKPAGVKMPNKKTLQACFENNSDGAGFMYPVNNQVQIKKGFMNFKALELGLKHLGDTTKIDLVLHFRYATQGSINPANCHPFPVSSKVPELKKTSITTDAGMVHNGVISFCERKRSKLSDTQIFIREYISQLPDNSLFNPAIHDLIQQAAGGRFVLMNSLEVALIGDFVEDKGVFYSNTTYKTCRRNVYFNSVLDDYDDYYTCDICGHYAKGKIYEDYYWYCDECIKAFKLDLEVDIFENV